MTISIEFLSDIQKEDMLSIAEDRLCLDDVKGVIDFLEQHPKINTLDLRGIKIETEPFKYLANNLKLKKLVMWHVHIGDEGAQILARNPSFEALCLLDCNIGDEGAKALAKMPHLKNLDLGQNKVGPEGVNALSQSPALEVLSLEFNGLDDEAVICLSSSNSLKKLQLDGNDLGDKAAVALAQSTSIQEIRFWGCHVSLVGVQALANNSRLTSLNLDYNSGISENDWPELDRIFNANTTLQELLIHGRYALPRPFIRRNQLVSNFYDELSKLNEKKLFDEDLKKLVNRHRKFRKIYQSIRSKIDTLIDVYPEPFEGYYSKLIRDFNTFVINAFLTKGGRLSLVTAINHIAKTPKSELDIVALCGVAKKIIQEIGCKNDPGFYRRQLSGPFSEIPFQFSANELVVQTALAILEHDFDSQHVAQFLVWLDSKRKLILSQNLRDKLTRNDRSKLTEFEQNELLEIRNKAKYSQLRVLFEFCILNGSFAPELPFQRPLDLCAAILENGFFKIENEHSYWPTFMLCTIM